MRRHFLPLLALVAIPAGLVAGCGGGSVGGSSSAGATTQRAATSTTGAHASTAAGATSTTRLKPSPHAFAAAAITPAAASSLSKHGQLVLPVATGGPGTVRAFGQAEIPGKGIVHVAEAKPMVIRRAGIVDLTLVLSPVARAQLAAGRPIDMFVAIWFSHGNVFQREEVHLKP